jgi:hypothetical protein
VISGTASAPDEWSVTLWGLPIDAPTGHAGAPIDIEVSDGERAWGYRTTDGSHVAAQRTGSFAGVVRISGMPLLEETRPTNGQVAPTLDATIEWHCEGSLR